MPKTCFVTVGSTLFDDLIEAVLNSKTFESLKKLDIDKVIIQQGAGKVIPKYLPKDCKNEDSGCFVTDNGLKIEYFRYKKSIIDDMKSADLIIGHAGAGTALDVLRLKKPMVSVINDKLMDNHQTELADRLAELGHLVKTTPTELHSALLQENTLSPKPFIQKNPNRFGEYIIEKLGYVV